MNRFIKSTIAATLVLAVAAVVAMPAQAASPGWRVVAATGPTNMPHHGHWQTLSLRATAGTFNLSFDGSTTPDLPFDVSAAQVEDALNALPSIGGAGSGVRVYGGGNVDGGFRAFDIEFEDGPLSETDVAQITAADGAVPLSGDRLLETGVASARLTVLATNVGSVASSGPVTVTVGPLPAGIVTDGTPTGSGWSCSPGAGQSSVSCTHANLVGSLATAQPIAVPLRVDGSAPSEASVQVSVSGGGAATGDTFVVPLRVSAADVEQGVAAFWAGAFDEDGQPFTQAGGHPNAGATMFLVNTNMSTGGNVVPAGDARDVVVDLPAGFVGNPLVTDRCSVTRFACGLPNTVVGDAKPMAGLYPPAITGQDGSIYSSEPPDGYAARFTFGYLESRITSVAKLRNEGDYGVSVTAPNIVQLNKIFGTYLYFDGFPAAAAGKPFFTNPTYCPGGVEPTLITTDSWQDVGVFSDPLGSDSPPVTGCGLVPFEPAMVVEPTTSGADSASGLTAEIDVPQENLVDPDEIATSHLKKTVVELPEGLSVNPSAATGLKGCSDAQVAAGSKALPSCPDASKLGTVRVTSPLVDQPLDGVLYLGTPKSTDPASGDMLRLFLVVRNDRYGVLVKLPGSTVADPDTGRLTATFDNNPRLPFDHLEVKLRGGSRGVLATPQVCGSAPTTSTLTPWSGTADVEQMSPFEVDANCGAGFAPSLAAGMSSAKARGNGSFSFKFTRPDGQQFVDGLSAKLPKGLLASVKDVPLCSSGQAAAGACPESSRIGLVDATAGAGDPFVLERKGTVYLTEGYKGCAYGLLVSVPVVAGPFDASSPETDLGSINVRQAVCVDPSTAEVNAISDPLPTIWHGIPIRTRSVTVIVDRPAFMLNPSGCASKQTSAVFDSDRGTTANASSGFHTAGCTDLDFEPNLTLALTGRKQVTTGKHPGVKAKVTQQGIGEAGIEQAVVRLPKSLALDPNNAQALCEFADGTKPDLENHCPAGSIVGRARAKTPLLKNDLVGNVYFVKNVRRDPNTGNEIRTLPMIIVALRGEIAVNLKGESSTTGAGRLVNTFANVPDAPISQFNLNIQGGNNGILAVTRTRKARINLCAGRHVAESEMDGHNSRRRDTDIRMKTPCTKQQVKNAKRAARKAAAKRAAAGGVGRG